LPFGIWIRRGLPETLHGPDVAAKPAPAATPRGRLGVLSDNRRILLLGLMVLASGTIGTYVFNYMTTFAEHSLHMPASVAFLASALGNVGGVAAGLYGGWLSDRIGRRPMMIWPHLAYVLLIVPIFFWITEARSALALIVGTFTLGVMGALSIGAFYAAVTETLPKHIRGGAFATIYALSIAIFGGTTQLIVTWLIHVTGSAMAPAWYLLGAAVVGHVARWLILESAPIKDPAMAVTMMG